MRRLGQITILFCATAISCGPNRPTNPPQPEIHPQDPSRKPPQDVKSPLEYEQAQFTISDDCTVTHKGKPYKPTDGVVKFDFEPTKLLALELEHEKGEARLAPLPDDQCKDVLLYRYRLVGASSRVSGWLDHAPCELDYEPFGKMAAPAAASPGSPSNRKRTPCTIKIVVNPVL